MSLQEWANVQVCRGASPKMHKWHKMCVCRFMSGPRCECAEVQVHRCMSEQGHTGAHGACQWVHGSVEMWAHSCMSGPMAKCGEVEVQRFICSQKYDCAAVQIYVVPLTWCGVAWHCMDATRCTWCACHAALCGMMQFYKVWADIAHHCYVHYDTMLCGVVWVYISMVWCDMD